MELCDDCDDEVEDEETALCDDCGKVLCEACQVKPAIVGVVCEDCSESRMEIAEEKEPTL